MTKLLAEMRREAGFTQKQLADLAGVHKNTVSLLERDMKGVTVALLDRLLAPLGYELEIVKK